VKTKFNLTEIKCLKLN